MNSTVTRYWARKNAGLCVHCASPTINGKVRCPRCTEIRRAWDEKFYSKQSKAMLCVRCAVPVIDGKVLCDKCATGQKDRQKQLEKERKSSHLCSRCGMIAQANMALCIKCNSIQNIKAIKLRKKRKETGLCSWCGVIVFHGTICRECMKISNENGKSRTARLSKLSLCICCGADPIIGLKYCVKCKEKTSIRRYKKVSSGKCVGCSSSSRPGKVYCKSCKDRMVRVAKKRLNTDPVFRLAKILRCRLYNALINGNKVGSAVRDLGCTVLELWSKLEAKFKSGMTRENYGKVWVVDHIRPLSGFDLSDLSEFRNAVHFSNLQPLFKKENSEKGSWYNGRRHRYKANAKI